MSHTEFHAPSHRDRDDEDKYEFFIPELIGKTRPRALFKLSIPQGEGIVRLVSANTINEITPGELEDLIQSLQNARDFLDNQPHHR